MYFISTCDQSALSITEQDLKVFAISEISPGVFHILYKDKNFIFKLLSATNDQREIQLSIEKRKKIVTIQDPVQQSIQSLGYHDFKINHSGALVAPMPGLVLEVKVKSGDLVKKGDHLVTLEAMKMENLLRAPHDGKILKVNISKSDKVDKNQILILFDNSH